METGNRVTCRVIWLALAGGLMALVASPSWASLANGGRNGLYAKSIPEVLCLEDSQVDLATAALIVSEKWSDVVQGLRYRDRLDEMALQIQERLSLRGIPADHRAIPVINEYLFEELGFSAVSQADDPNDLFLHSVMDSRKGYCLSLSILYLSLGERLGLPLYGVVVPGHFFVRYDSGSRRFNIETTARGASATDDHYRLANRVPENDQGLYLRNLTKHQTLACMFNNFGVVYLDTNYLDLAEEALVLAVQITPMLAEARVNLGNTYIRQDRKDLALVHYAEAARINPLDAKIRQALGNVYLHRGQTDLAVRELQCAVDRDPNCTEAIVQLADAYCQKNQYSRAEQVLKKGLAGHPDEAGLYSQLGEAYRFSGETDQAIEAYQNALARQPKLVQANFGLAICHHKQGKVDQEILAYKRILSTEPSFLPAMMNLGLAYVTNKDYPAAIALYEKVIQVDPNIAGVHHNLGMAYSETQDPNRAEAEFLKAVELDPKQAGAHHWLAIHDYKEGRYAEAWDHLMRAKDLGADVTQDQIAALSAKLPQEVRGKKQEARSKQ
jgi:tetratricopeptide (TPR) repeat protein